MLLRFSRCTLEFGSQRHSCSPHPQASYRMHSLLSRLRGTPELLWSGAGGERDVLNTGRVDGTERLAGCRNPTVKHEGKSTLRRLPGNGPRAPRKAAAVPAELTFLFVRVARGHAARCLLGGRAGEAHASITGRRAVCDRQSPEKKTEGLSP